MKKFAGIFLSALLLLTLGVPALAAETAEAAEETTDQRLAQVTAKVKRVLDIGDMYEDFSGDLWENELVPVWSLDWSREEDRIHVEATEDGGIVSYYFSEEGGSRYSSDFAPAFPTMTREEAQRYAEAFVEKVLDSGESVEFEDRANGRLSTENFYFSGKILLNGLDSPFSFSLTLRSSDGKVIRFYRDRLEQSTIGGVPSGAPSASQNSAGALLKDTLALRLEYVLEGSQAVLRYLPESGDSYYVDAQTGKLVNLTEIYEQVQSDDRNMATAGGYAMDTAAVPEAAAQADSGAEYELSQVELSGIAKLEGVQSKEALDEILRKTSELGLSKYTLANASYSLNQETDEVTARLVYTRKDEDGTWRRTITCDGKTGDLLTVSSSAPYSEEREVKISERDAKKRAEAFLKKIWGDAFAASALYENEPWDSERSYRAVHSFSYAQKENGYFLPANSLNVSVDITDGSISGLNRQWTEDVTFDSPKGIVKEAEALDAWFDHYDTALAYRSVPVKLDPNMEDAAPLMEQGYSYFYTLKLSYALAEPENLAEGVDAKSGEVVYQDGAKGETALSYSDLSGCEAREQIEALAEYGIGWMEDACQPQKELTQMDWIALLASTDNYRFNPETDDAGNLYRYAYSAGLLKPADREDEKVLTRGETVKLLLDCAGYGEVAALRGIFTCTFADKDEIPADLTGYAALAQGLGLVDGEGSFAADRAATRSDAAVMLYQFMKR